MAEPLTKDMIRDELKRARYENAQLLSRISQYELAAEISADDSPLEYALRRAVSAYASSLMASVRDRTTGFVLIINSPAGLVAVHTVDENTARRLQNGVNHVADEG